MESLCKTNKFLGNMCPVPFHHPGCKLAPIGSRAEKSLTCFPTITMEKNLK